MGIGFGFGFGMFEIMFFIVFGLAICVFLMTFIKGMKEWNHNNHSPRLTVPATVVAKRTNISRHRHSGTNGHHHHHTSTTYFATFQVESGDRMEFAIPHNEFGYLVEGDKGRLTFQGTRFKGFQRQ